MTTPEELIDEALYLPPGEEVRPLIWPRPFSARVRIPVRVTPILGESGKPKQTTDRRFQWRVEDRPTLETQDGTPLGPLKMDETYEGRPLILTTRRPDAAKTGKALKRRVSH